MASPLFLMLLVNARGYRYQTTPTYPLLLPHCWYKYGELGRVSACTAVTATLSIFMATLSQGSTVEHCQDCVLRDTLLCSLLLFAKNLQSILRLILIELRSNSGVHASVHPGNRVPLHSTDINMGALPACQQSQLLKQ